MIKAPLRLSLRDRTLHSIAIRSNIDRQNLQRDFAIELRVLSNIHVAHPATQAANGFHKTVEFCAYRQAHWF
jgi:hypothetical protein